MDASQVARAYIASAAGSAKAEEEIGAKNILLDSEDDIIAEGRSIIKDEKKEYHKLKLKQIK